MSVLVKLLPVIGDDIGMYWDTMWRDLPLGRVHIVYRAKLIVNTFPALHKPQERVGSKSVLSIKDLACRA